MTTASATDWAEELQEDFRHESARPIRWNLWANQTLDAIRHQNSGLPYDAEHGERAVKMLREIAAYLDQQYDSGFDGIALMPLSGFNLSLDR